MGACFSSSTSRSNPHRPITNVVDSSTGNLRQFQTPVTSSHVLAQLFTSTSPSSENYFISNSDALCYDEHIPAVGPNEELLPNQIYIVFPVSKLQYRLSVSDMAALAVKASAALVNSKPLVKEGYNTKYNVSIFGRRDRRRAHNSKISPYVSDQGDSGETFDEGVNYVTVKSSRGFFYKEKAAKTSGELARSSSLRKLQRYSSKRAKMAVRSFRMRLTTIHEEGSVVQ